MKLKKKHDTREAWLKDLAQRLRPMFKLAKYPLPKEVRFSCGWPSTRPFSETKRVIGECWFPQGPKGYANIFISPYLADEIEVGATLVHELVHAAVGKKCGHKGPFIRCMDAIGLVGKPTETEAGPELQQRLNKLMKSIGKYPHEKLNKSGRKKQTTRLIKLTCPKCGYIIRTTEKWIEEGVPKCHDGSRFRVEKPEEDE
jgi:predicted RNA-binding Zn-ribbon protein involved in translation (DUF1610 family)